MKLELRQKLTLFSAKYEVLDEAGTLLYTAECLPPFGNKLTLRDADGGEVAELVRETFTFGLRYEIRRDGQKTGSIAREFDLFQPPFVVEHRGWRTKGEPFRFDYTVFDTAGAAVAVAAKRRWEMTDIYELEITDPDDACDVLLLALAIDLSRS
ncbi:MAG: hypothetical protein IJC43_08395 [Clostridia bacterium]|nr:hypothetical protein [Clostridia bacterium]